MIWIKLLLKSVSSNYQTVSTDIEAWYSNKTDEEIKTGLKTVFDAFKKEIPSCTVGNYGIPVSDLNVFRYNRTEPEEEIIKLWKKMKLNGKNYL